MSFNSYFIVFLLCTINLINYMDRFTIAGVLKNIQAYFDISAATSGLLQTAFITSYMIFAPLFGFLGDRYSRKYIIIFGVLFWSSVTLMSSFVQPHHTLLFFFFRALVGIGEASYATVAPTLIADLFVGSKRSTMLALFYFAIPVGSGLGYIVGIGMMKAFGHWNWALRFTPVFGVISVIGFAFTSEPTRGAVDGLTQPNEGEQVETSQGFSLINTLKVLKDDFIYLISVPSYLHTTFGFTCVCFSIGALSWWSPYYMQAAIEGSSEESVGLIFGIIACLGGLFGVMIGYASSRYFRAKYPTADPYICAIGVFLSIPCIFVGITFARTSPVLSWISIFLGITFLSTNWSVVVDILLYVIIPNKRATAQAIQILISHILGDAASPFIIGAMSDILEKNHDKYTSLSYALYLTPIVLILGGFFFVFSARYILKDEFKCKRMISGSDSALSSNDDNSSNQQSTFVATESTNNLINNASLYQRAVEYNDPSVTTNSY